MANIIIIRDLGKKDYLSTWFAMRNHVDNRSKYQVDEIWFVEHPPVFTLGQNGKREHLLNPGEIPIVQTDRGGQVTYHGPGQIVAYILMDLRRKKISVRHLVENIETAIIELLNGLQINAAVKEGAPGVYVDNAKICSLGLRIRHGCSYHGLALNMNMDLEPFSRINPCGYANLQMTQITDFGVMPPSDIIKSLLIRHLCRILDYHHVTISNHLDEIENSIKLLPLQNFSNLLISQPKQKIAVNR